MASSKFNPFRDRLTPLYSKRLSLKTELASEQSQLDAVLKFDRETAIRVIDENTAKAGDLTTEVESLKSQLDHANEQVQLLTTSLQTPTKAWEDAPAVLGGALTGGLAVAGIGGFAGICLRIAAAIASSGGATGYHFFSANKENSARKKALADAVHQRDVLAAAFDRLTSDAVRILRENADRLHALKERQEFDQDAARERILLLNIQLADLNQEIEELEYRRTKLDEQLGSLPEEIENGTSELGRLQARHKELKELVNQLKAIDGTARDAGYRRAKIHEYCHNLTGSSPEKVDYGSDAEFKKAGNPLVQAQRTMAEFNALTRQINKKVERANELRQQAERTIKTLILDGNNLCYESSGMSSSFIGIGAVLAVARWLADNRRDIDVKVIFDPSISGRLTQLSAGSTDQEHKRWRPSDLQKAFKGCAKVTVARGSADKTLLPAAEDAHTYIISNDLFAEFSDSAAVRDGRVFRFNLFNRIVTVTNLDLAAPYAN